MSQNSWNYPIEKGFASRSEGLSKSAITLPKLAAATVDSRESFKDKKDVVDLESFSKFVNSIGPAFKGNKSKSHKNDSSMISMEQPSISSDVTWSLKEQQQTPSKNLNISKQSHGRSLEASMQGKDNSFFFNGPERFEENVNLNYFDHSSINPMVNAQKKQNHHSSSTFELRGVANASPVPYKLDNILENPKQQYDLSKLHLKSQGLLAPHQRRADLEEVKANMSLLSQWKADHGEKSRAYRLVQGAYRSGITQVDGPLQDNTQLYKREHESILAKENEETIRKNARLSYIQKYVATNPKINFARAPEPAAGYLVSANEQLLINRLNNASEDMFPRRGKNAMALGNNAASFDRLFGHNLEDQRQKISGPRSQFLYSQDVKGKPQNIISNTVNQQLSLFN